MKPSSHFGLGYSNQYRDDLYQYLRKKAGLRAMNCLKETGLVNIDEQRGGHDKFWNRVDVSDHGCK